MNRIGICSTGKNKYYDVTLVILNYFKLKKIYRFKPAEMSSV